MARARYDVAGKVVLITGAARGIGLEAARRLHARGATVAMVGLEPDLLEAEAGRLGERAWWEEADVTDSEGLQKVVSRVVEELGGIDVVIANAGVAANGTVASMDPAAFERTIEVNLLGVYRTVRAALPSVTSRRGYILVIASASALVHTPMMAAYTASKAGVEAFADALRGEVAHTGTRVGVAYFSFIDTDMVRRGMDRESARVGRERLGNAFSRWAPVSEVGDAILAGVERRARHVMVPKSLKPALYLRAIVQPISEWQARRSGVADVIRLAEQEPTEMTTPQPASDRPPAAAAPPSR